MYIRTQNIGYFILDKSLFDMGDKWLALKNNITIIIIFK